MDSAADFRPKIKIPCRATASHLQTPPARKNSVRRGKKKPRVSGAFGLRCSPCRNSLRRYVLFLGRLLCSLGTGSCGLRGAALSNCPLLRGRWTRAGSRVDTTDITGRTRTLGQGKAGGKSKSRRGADRKFSHGGFPVVDPTDVNTTGVDRFLLHDVTDITLANGGVPAGTAASS